MRKATIRQFFVNHHPGNSGVEVELDDGERIVSVDREGAQWWVFIAHEEGRGQSSEGAEDDAS